MLNQKSCSDGTQGVIASFKSPPKYQRIKRRILSADKQGFTQIIGEEKVLVFQSLFYPCLSADKNFGFYFGFLLAIALVVPFD
ncbi:MAG: hypothetical protein WC360_03480, partial [Opitutales bacterium]